MNFHVYLVVDDPERLRTLTQLTQLQRLIAVGETRSTQLAFEHALCRHFGMPAELPGLAAISWLGEVQDAADDHLMYADPVHMSLQRDYFSMAYPAPLALSESDVEQLQQALNQHFTQDNIRFCVAGSGRWYVRLKRPAAMTTSLLSAVVGRDVRGYQPEGADAAYWRSISNEVQMLLHEHAVNQARESRGKLAVNSLWFSGTGSVPATLKSSLTAVFGNQALLKGLARLADVCSSDVPLDPAGHLRDIAGEQLLLLDVTEVDAWILPLTQALRARKISTLNLNLLLPGYVHSSQIKPLDLWKFWRKPKPLMTI